MQLNLDALAACEGDAVAYVRVRTRVGVTPSRVADACDMHPNLFAPRSTPSFRRALKVAQHAVLHGKVRPAVRELYAVTACDDDATNTSCRALARRLPAWHWSAACHSIQRMLGTLRLAPFPLLHTARHRTSIIVKHPDHKLQARGNKFTCLVVHHP